MKLTIFGCTLIAALLLSSCEKSMEVAGAAEGNSKLTVQTRADANSAKVSYPVTVYAMNSDGQCVRRQQLLSDNDELSFNLDPATYHIYAVGGATDGDYTLPTLENAVATSVITLNSEARHGDLMTASNTITLSENESNTLTLTMIRKVMHLQNLVINNVPTTVDAVAVTFTPLYDNLLLNGSYTTTSGEYGVALTEQADGTTWQITDDDLYMLPAADNATITVKFTTGQSTTSYSYSCPQPLEANKHIRITGTFEDELILTGTITGATWDGTTTIEFTFSSNGSTTVDTGNDNGGGNQGTQEEGVEEGAAPEVGTVYKGAYVLNSTDDAIYTYVTLLNKTEVDISGEAFPNEEEFKTVISDALAEFNANDTYGITNWRLPTGDELISISMGPVNQILKTISGYDAIANHNYYYRDGDAIKCGLPGSAGTMNRSYTLGNALRPVTTVKFNK